MSFLAKVAHQIFNEHRDNLDKVLIVFNNRRAGLFLQRELQKLDSRPFFLPRIIGIDDLVKELGGLRIEPSEFLIFELYDIHRLKAKAPEPFEDFIALGDPSEYMQFTHLSFSFPANYTTITDGSLGRNRMSEDWRKMRSVAGCVI